MAVMLENEKLRVVINEHGAELASLMSKENEFEYMWIASIGNATQLFFFRSKDV